VWGGEGFWNRYTTDPASSPGASQYKDGALGTDGQQGDVPITLCGLLSPAMCGREGVGKKKKKGGDSQWAALDMAIAEH
jgi:hypothetical protein